MLRNELSAAEFTQLLDPALEWLLSRRAVITSTTFSGP